MKKGKFLSVLTSLAMTGTMMLSAIPFTASAAGTTDKIGLEMVSDKTSFTLEEVQAGTARTTVYCDSTKAFSESDQVVCIEFCLKPDQWGTVDPINLEITTDNQLSVNDGANNPRKFETNATTTGSIWDNTNYKKLKYGCYNYLDVDANLVYADEYMPKATVMSSSLTGNFRIEDANMDKHIANFDVQLPTNLAEGTYTINFVDAKAVIGDVVAGTADSYDITSATGITITVGEGQPAVTTTTTQAPVVTTASSVSWNYVGSAALKAETGVSAAVGEKVLVPVYVDTFGQTCEGLAAKIIYDESALDMKFIDPYDLDYPEYGLEPCSSPTYNSDTKCFLIKLASLDPMENDPTVPIAICEFTVKDGASGTYEISFENTLDPGKDVECVQETFADGTPTNYLQVTKAPGSIIVGEATTTTKATTTTTAGSVSWNYVGSAVLKAETGVSAAVGDTVKVPVYIDTLGQTCEGLAAKIIYDSSALDMKFIDPYDEGYPEYGLEPCSSPTYNSDTDCFLIKLASLDPMENDPTVPIAICEFTVKDGASGTYEITFENTLDPKKDVECVQETFADGTPTNYLQIVKAPGSIIVGEATTTTEKVTTTTEEVTTTTSATAATTASTVTVTSIVTSVSDVTSISVVTSIVTSVSDVTSIVTSVSDVTSISVVTSISDVTNISNVTSISVVTSISDVTNISNVTVTSIVTQISQVTVTSIVTDVSNVTSIVTQLSQVTVTSIVTQISQVTVTSLVTVTSYVTDATTAASTTAATTTTDAVTSADISIVFPSDIVDLSGNNAFWYFADETAWHLDAFAVEVNGEVVDGAELTFSAASPAEAYDGKNFDYEITVTYTHEDGTVAEATFTAKIGVRGDANLDHKANARDAATIARDLAQLYSTKKSTLTAEDGFGIFLANSDFVYTATPEAGKNGYAKKATDHYGQYDLAVRDAAALATWLSRVYTDKDLTLYEVAVLKK